MYELTNDTLTITLLDPVADRDRMGPRYCTGGYIFQIADATGPLLSGPSYPESFNWFDGQGIPDSFAQGALRDPDAPSAQALIPGIGVCDTVARRVLEFCEWEVRPDTERATFSTAHAWGPYSLRLTREVTLQGRVVTSTTRVDNPGRTQLPIRWFPHPFYPVPPRDRPRDSGRAAGVEYRDEPLCRLPAPVRVPEGTTYTNGPGGYLRCSDLSEQQAVPVTCNPNGPLTVLQRHPRLGLVAAGYTFAAEHVLVWGNPNTFSFEPYLEQTVGGGMALEWTASYLF